MIREAVPGDLPRLLALQAELASAWPDLLELAVNGTPTDDGPLALVAYLENGTDELASVDPVGYVLAVPGVPGDSGEGALTAADGAMRAGNDPRYVYLAEVVVAPNHRREGHGTALIEAAASRFADYDQLRLTARASDERALAFYQTNDFRVIDELPDHYDEGGDGDGLLLARDLA